MSHGPMSEGEGDLGPAIKADRLCPKPACQSVDVVVQAWGSHCGGFEDDKYTCRTCGHVWWLEGPDA